MMPVDFRSAAEGLHYMLLVQTAAGCSRRSPSKRQWIEIWLTLSVHERLKVDSLQTQHAGRRDGRPPPRAECGRGSRSCRLEDTVPAKLKRVGLDHEVDDAGLVVDGYEHDTFGRTRPLARKRQPSRLEAAPVPVAHSITAGTMRLRARSARRNTG